MKSNLFSPIKIRNLEFKNRIVVSPMCEYSAKEGVPNNWHLVHLGSRAVGGAALVIVEATGVSPEGRISPGDLGIWNEKQIEAFSEITLFIKEQNSLPGIQLAHAGRKASTHIPWQGSGAVKESEGGWKTLAPSAIPFDANYPVPKEMSKADIRMVCDQFVAATKNAMKAGFEVVELHMAHGYLLNEFLTPLSNKRTDEYGGSIENRMRFPLEVTEGVRKVWPQDKPLFVRISATDWVEGGWTLEDSIVLGKKLKDLGVDLIDCSTGGSSPSAQIKSGPGYQVEFSEGVRKNVGIKTGAVGIITNAKQAEDILQSGKADMILMARELLRDPYFPLHAAKELGEDIHWPVQYERAKR